MKWMMRLHITFYLVLLAFILAIPQKSMDGNILKLALFLCTIGIFILLTTYYVVLSFNKKIEAVKKYAYFNVGLMCFDIIVFLTLGHLIYTKMTGIGVLLSIFLALFLVSNILNFRIQKIIADQKFDFMKEVKLFYKMGRALDETPLNNAISKLDYLFYGYSAAVFVSENIYFFAAVVGIILILSIKYLRAIRGEFLKSRLITKNETYLSIISYYFFYLLSIIWMFFIPNISTLLVGAVSILPIKIYIRRIAEKVYEEKEAYDA
jgi:hypothetical protein